MYGIRHALPLLIARGGGSIVNTMSSEVWMGEGQRVAYQTAKSGLIGLNRHTATVGGKHGVRSNIVAPGVTLTGAALNILNQEYRDQILASVRSTRLGVPEDIAAMVTFLFSDDPRRRRRQSDVRRPNARQTFRKGVRHHRNRRQHGPRGGPDIRPGGCIRRRM
jgi:NAD(P)-dependent dehydrogenase (short-subunit alcohol dehydrogenase family)